MRKKIKLRLPPAVYFFIALGVISVAFYFLPDIKLSKNIIEISSALAMPEVFVSELVRAKDLVFEKLNIPSGDSPYIQKGGSVNELNEDREFASLDDLLIMPDDISENMRVLSRSVKEYDGTVTEKTYIDYQATDSSGNIFLRNITESSEVDIDSIVQSDFSLPVTDYTEPVVLIYHTHSTESYLPEDCGKFYSGYPSRSDDKNVNMIRIGDEIAAVLEYHGIGVIHDRTIYDSVYTGAYGKSRTGIEAILEENPSVVITLDIHRDAIHASDSEYIKPTVAIGGEKAAQMMIIAGSEGGNVTDFPSWKTNLEFAVNLQKTVNNKYEGLMRPIFFCNRKYNMDVTPYSLLIEVGTDSNTLGEAALSGRLLGDALADLIKKEAEK